MKCLHKKYLLGLEIKTLSIRRLIDDDEGMENNLNELFMGVFNRDFNLNHCQLVLIGIRVLRSVILLEISSFSLKKY